MNHVWPVQCREIRLNGFAVYEEAAVVVEVDYIGVLLGGRLGNSWRNRWSRVGRGSGMSLTGWAVRREERVCVGRGLGLEMERGRRKKQIPLFARNDNAQEFRPAVRRVEAEAMRAHAKRSKQDRAARPIRAILRQILHERARTGKR
jgi:hypothetical protein